jgi:hypothetical protein
LTPGEEPFSLERPMPRTPNASKPVIFAFVARIPVR